MAIFKVGEKVRVVVANACPEALGREAVITEDLGGGRYAVSIPGIYSTHPCGWWNGDSGCFEPLRYDGLQVVEWKTCEWRPEHMREVA